MVDTVQHDRPVRRLSRQQFLRLGGGLLGLLAAAKIGIDLLSTPAETVEPTATPEPRPSALTFKWIAQGIKLSENFQYVFNTDTTTPGLDLPVISDEVFREQVNSILHIANMRERVLTLLGFLNVENNPQYDLEKTRTYACNRYALHVAHLLLGDDTIGSRYRESDGEPWVLGRNDGQVNWEDPVDIERFNREHPILTGNNLDTWLSRHGVRYGWMGVDETRLNEAMQTGRYIALVVNTESYVAQEQRKAAELEAQRIAAELAGATPSPSVPPFSGHVAMFVPGGEPGEYGVTQATNNHTYRALDTPRDRLLDPQYHYYLHEIPQESWIPPSNPQG
ncbi:MAG: hypothetical protein WC489_03910 [Patescibacteria group bacterium]